jgi:hypothetical protein
MKSVLETAFGSRLGASEVKEEDIVVARVTPLAAQKDSADVVWAPSGAVIERLAVTGTPDPEPGGGAVIYFSKYEDLQLEHGSGALNEFKMTKTVTDNMKQGQERPLAYRQWHRRHGRATLGAAAASLKQKAAAMWSAIAMLAGGQAIVGLATAAMMLAVIASTLMTAPASAIDGPGVDTAAMAMTPVAHEPMVGGLPFGEAVNWYRCPTGTDAFDSVYERDEKTGVVYGNHPHLNDADRRMAFAEVGRGVSGRLGQRAQGLPWLLRRRRAVRYRNYSGATKRSQALPATATVTRKDGRSGRLPRPRVGGR